MSEGYLKRKELRTYPHVYATLNGINLQTSYGMELVAYDVGEPQPLINLIAVPGRPGKLDATLALNGKVNYISRSVRAEFVIRDITYDEWQSRISTLFPLFQGVESKLTISTDPNYYYKGRFLISKEKNNPVTGSIVLECTEAFPYKLETVTVEDTRTAEQKSVNVLGGAYNGAVSIYASSTGDVTFLNDKGIYDSVRLKAGTNAVPELHLRQGSNTLLFSYTGAVRITWERGIL